MNSKYKGLAIAGIIVGAFLLIGIIFFMYYKGLYNKEVTLNQGVKKSWADVESNYTRRADLIPNLVEVVKGYASHEKETLTEVMNARAKATQIKIDAGNLTPEKIAAFQQAQSGLGSALNKLMAVAENYPNLKANESFMGLQKQLEGTENRINTARIRYNESVESYNKFALRFMVNIFLHPEEKAYFQADEGDAEPVEVSF